ncbi:hypothetical protein D3C87_2125990 [compost metagenome]
MILLDGDLGDIGQNRIGPTKGDQRHPGEERKGSGQTFETAHKDQRTHRRLPNQNPEHERKQRASEGGFRRLGR